MYHSKIDEICVLIRCISESEILSRMAIHQKELQAGPFPTSDALACHFGDFPITATIV